MERTHAPRPAGDLLNAVGRLSLKQLEVFHVIQENPDGLQVAEIGKALGMHPNTVRGHLDELMAAGVVNRHVAPAPGRGRPSHVYTARVAHTNMASKAIIALVEVLASTVASGDTDTAKDLGRQWAGRVNQRRHDNLRVDLDTATRHTAQTLREMGFDPVLRPECSNARVRELGLHACPFVAERGTRPATVVCALHEGFLDQGAGDVKVELLPHDRPGECGARLSKMG